MAELKTFNLTRKVDQGYWGRLGLNLDDETITEAIHKGFPPEVYTHLLDLTKLSQKEFHSVTRISMSTLKRRLKRGEHFSPQESDVMYRLTTLLELATNLLNDKDKARKWIRSEVYGLGGKRPLDMVSTSADFEIVKDLIGRIEHGVIS